VHDIEAIAIIVPFVLSDFFLSVYPWLARLIWGEINALPLNYSLGAELGLFAAEVTISFVGMVVSSSIFPFALLDFFHNIDPWPTWLIWGEIWNVSRLSAGHCHYINIYINCSNQ